MSSYLSTPKVETPAQQATHGILWLGLLLLLLSGCATQNGGRSLQTCPPEIPAPILQVGDAWGWQDDKGATSTRRYIRQTSDGLFEMETTPGKPQFYYDQSHTLRKVFRDGQWVTQPSPDYPELARPVLIFPLQPGKSWSSMLLARSSVGNELLTYRVTYTVLGCEQVTVPAGTFFAVAIKETQTLTTVSGVWGDRTSWYAPDVKFLIKRLNGPASHSGFWATSRDLALTFFRVGTPSVPAGQLEGSATTPGPSGEPPSPPAVTVIPLPQLSTGPAPISAILPTWERGYEWKYRWTSPRGAGTFVRTVIDEEQIGGVTYYTMRSGTRDILHAKDDLAWLMDRVEGGVEMRATPANRGLAWPLFVGKEWEDKYHWENIPQRTTETRLRRYRVAGVESVTVPAGTFYAFKVISRDPTGHTTSEYWYSPEAKWLVKERRFLSYGVEERELLEFRLTRTPDASPGPSTGR